MGSKRFAALVLAAPFVVAAFVFVLAGLARGMGIVDAVAALIDQSASRRLNPLLGSVLGLVPAALLLLCVWLARRHTDDAHRVRAVAASGLVMMVLVLGWGHWSVWALFLPTRTPLSFPHGLELVIAPLFFTPPAILAAGLVAWLSTRRR